MLREIAGKPLILYTADRANEAQTVSRVIVATDDERIRNAVTAAGHEAVITRAEHNSGSDRIAEVAESLPERAVIVNVQGDEPIVSPATIDRAVNALLEASGPQPPDIVTVFEPIVSANDLFDPNVVKVVLNDKGRAVYFSRSPIPYLRGAATEHRSLELAVAAEPDLLRRFKKHAGLYVYRREFLIEFTRLEQTRLEKCEMLEQLRALENAAHILVVPAAEASIGVDTPEDLEAVRALIESRGKAAGRSSDGGVS